MTTHKPDALIGPGMAAKGISVGVIGGGIGGLSAALSLLHAGFDVHVYEQASTLGEVGAGVQVSPNASRILHRFGLAEGLARTGVKPLAWHQRRWDDGRTLLRTPLAEPLEATFGFPTTRSTARKVTRRMADAAEVRAPDTEVRGLLRRLLTPEGLADPYAIYAELRERESSGEGLGRMVLGHAQASEALTSRSMSAQRIDSLVARLDPSLREEIEPAVRTLKAIVTFRGPPGHTRVTRLPGTALKATAVSRQAQVIEQAANQLRDELAKGSAAAQSRDRAAGTRRIAQATFLTEPCPAGTPRC